MNRLIGILIIVITLFAQFFITKSFGNNFFPGSPSELGLDLLSILFLGFGIFMIRTKRKLF